MLVQPTRNVPERTWDRACKVEIQWLKIRFVNHLFSVMFTSMRLAQHNQRRENLDFESRKGA